jgi:polyisoprenoid-binding protein YceI
MFGRALTLVLVVSAAARADKTWVIEPGQSLVSAYAGPAEARLSATAIDLSGQIVEQADGAVRAEIHIPLESFTTGARSRDARLKSFAAQFPEIVFEGAAPAPGKDGTLHLDGTLSFHGVSRPFSLPVSVARAGAMAFGHATLTVHLRDFGIAIPALDEVRVEIDAGFRPQGALAAR